MSVPIETINVVLLAVIETLAGKVLRGAGRGLVDGGGSLLQLQDVLCPLEYSQTSSELSSPQHPVAGGNPALVGFRSFPVDISVC